MEKEKGKSADSRASRVSGVVDGGHFSIMTCNFGDVAVERTRRSFNLSVSPATLTFVQECKQDTLEYLKINGDNVRASGDKARIGGFLSTPYNAET